MTDQGGPPEYSEPSPEILTPKRGRGIARKTLDLRIEILKAFDEADKPVTVRQMFYMLTVRDAVEKTEKGYGKVVDQLVAMRREEWPIGTGQKIPYSWIADNTRIVRKPATYTDLGEYMEYLAPCYQQDLWVNSDEYVQVWCEKDALSGVIEPVTEEYDVALMVTRGYASESYVYRAAEAMKHDGRHCHVYYVGDFDPSGWDMARDLEERLTGFEAPMTFTRLAVNQDQVSEWDLPTRPSKEKDTRCGAFYELFGDGTESVELDAIHPNELRKLVRDAIEQHVDHDDVEALREQGAETREKLRKIAEDYKENAANDDDDDDDDDEDDDEDDADDDADDDA